MQPTEKHDGFAGQRIVVVPRSNLASARQHPLLRPLVATDCGYYPKAAGHTCVRKRGCPEVIYIYCSEGRGWCEVAGRRHDIAKNDLLVLPAGIAHAYGANREAPWTIHWFHALGESVSVYLKMLGVSSAHPVVSLGGEIHLLPLFEDVLSSLEHGSTVRHLIYAAHSLTQLMGQILRNKEEVGFGEATVRERIEKSVEYMKGHLREPLRVAALAAMVHLSRSHYTALFRRVTGYAPLNYLNHLRMQRAVQLLNSTGLTIKQISDRTGYADPFYFSRAFRRLHNHSPSAHRRR